MTIIAFRLQLLSFSDNHHGRTSLSVIAWASFLAKIVQQYNYLLLFFCSWEEEGVSQTIWAWDPNNYFWGMFPFLMVKENVTEVHLVLYLYENMRFGSLKCSCLRRFHTQTSVICSNYIEWKLSSLRSGFGFFRLFFTEGSMATIVNATRTWSLINWSCEQINL